MPGLSVPEYFFFSLREALVDAMGPMAYIVLADHMKLIGASFDGFPRDKVDGLVDAVSREIFDASTREHFRRDMSERIRGF